MDVILEELPDIQHTIRVAPDVSIRSALDRLFEKQPISVTDGSSEQSDDIVAVRDGEIVATASADTLLRTVFLINSDVYTTGSRPLTETAFPDVLKAFEETPFRLRGYPESDSEKLLFIAASRGIERIAHAAGEGTLRVGFQAFSRLVDERGTYRVYEQLSETDLDVHIYGVEDTSLPAEFGFTPHAGTSRFYRRSWFVVFQPSSADGQPAGMFAVEREPNEWKGFWTFHRQRVDSMDRIITKRS